MKRVILLVVGLFLLTASGLQAQLAQLRVIGKPQKSPDEFVGSNHRDANGRICAMIKVVSDMEGFQYDAYNGVVSVEDQPGQDLVYLQPDERVLEIFHEGYKPLRLILSNYGIQLASRQVWTITIGGVGKAANTLPVTFLVQPPDAAIEVDGVAAQAGKPIDLSPGRHRLTIRKQGFRTIDREINVDKQHVLFEFTLQEVDLQPVTIKSVPSGADIFLNGVNQGQTDRGLWLYPGEYRLKIQMPGYVPVEQTITVAENQDNTFAFTLLKNAGYLQISVNPPDATITINNQPYRATDKISLPPGTYELIVSRNGYLDVKDQITIKIGETVRRNYHLIKNVATLTLDVQPANATVLINKTDYSGRGTVELAPGVYKIEVLAKGYYPQSETLTLKRGQVINRSYRLIQRVGKLRFSVAPVFADVQLKRNGRTIQRWQGLKMIKNLPIGRYEIVASANGYSTERKSIDILENQTTNVDLKLEKGVFFTGSHRNTRVTGRLRLAVTPSDAQVSIDGTPITDHYLILPVGKYRIRCQKSGFMGQSKSVRIRQNQETRIEINLSQKSKGSAFTRSLIFPGWGQSYKEHAGRGWLYRLAFLSSAAGLLFYGSIQ
ncbi:PEGA domain-containing protein [Calditrichota bacterium LG25]